MNALNPTGRRRDTEYFGEGDRFYFLDVIALGDERHYLAITRSDKLPSGQGYLRSQIILFEEDLLLFVEALTSLLGRLSTGTSFSSQQP